MVDGKQILARLSNDPTNESKHMAPDILNRRNGMWKAAHALAKPTAEKEAAIRTSDRWNRYEKKEKLAALVPDVQGLIAEALKDRERISNTLAGLTKQVNTVPPRYVEPTVRQLRGMEIRQVLRTLPEVERVKLFAEAAEQNNTEHLDAVLTAPDRVLAPEVVTRGVEKWAQTTMPTVWAEREQTQLLYDQVSSLVEHLNGWVRSLETE
mgnify:CR=1 FL=1